MNSRLLSALLTAACLCAQVRRAPPNRNGNSPASQTSSLKPGTIEGATINSVTNTPVKKAVVTVRNTTQNFSYLAASDVSGHFQFPEVEPGTYVVMMASAQGFSYLPPPRDKLATSVITVAEDGHVTGVAVQLRPFGVISGKVVDEDGEPLPGANIQALRYDYTRGPKTLLPAGGASTNDRGEYRIFDLQPGRYFLRASIGNPGIGPNMRSNMPELGYAPTFYPRGTDPVQATRTEVTPGGEAFGMDFRLQKVSVYHIRGKVENARGNIIQAMRCDTPASNFGNSVNVTVQPDGRFDIGGLTPGPYCLTYSYFSGTDKGLSASETINISDQSVNGLSLTAVAIPDVQGVLQTEGTVTLSTPGQAAPRINAQPVSGIGRFGNVTVKDDGTFTLPDMTPGVYLVTVAGLPQGTYVKSMEYGEQDVSDGMVNVSPTGGSLKIHVASDSGQLNATVLNDKGDPTPDVLVNIVPQGRMANRRDLRRTAVSDKNGKVQQTGLTPGDYKIVALDDNDQNLVLMEEFMVQLGSKAASVIIHSGGNDGIELKVVSAEEVDKIKSKL